MESWWECGVSLDVSSLLSKMDFEREPCFRISEFYKRWLHTPSKYVTYSTHSFSPEIEIRSSSHHHHHHRGPRLHILLGWKLDGWSLKKGERRNWWTNIKRTYHLIISSLSKCPCWIHWWGGGLADNDWLATSSFHFYPFLFVTSCYYYYY